MEAYQMHSPPQKPMLAMNSDDFAPTSELRESSSAVVTEPLVTVVARKDDEITLGRGTAATIKIGRRNRNISRIHARITYKDEYCLQVVGLNGVVVDGVLYNQHESASLKDRSLINVLGSKILFLIPEQTNEQKEQQTKEYAPFLDEPTSPPSELSVLDSSLEHDHENEHEHDEDETKENDPKFTIDDRHEEQIDQNPAEHVKEEEEQQHTQFVASPVEIKPEEKPSEPKYREEDEDLSAEEDVVVEDEEKLSDDDEDGWNEHYADVIIETLGKSKKRIHVYLDRFNSTISLLHS